MTDDCQVVICNTCDTTMEITGYTSSDKNDLIICLQCVDCKVIAYVNTDQDVSDYLGNIGQVARITTVHTLL